MEEELRYLRIGTSVYKIIRRPNVNGDTTKMLSVWKYSTLNQDEGKDYAASIPKFDGFCTVPNHINYQRTIGNFYNLYEPISHVPVKGEFPHIDSLVHHIFGEQYELGMDYLQLLYTRPVQKLPVLLLVSEERNTGKSTFLNFLKVIFQDNVTFNTNEDFRSQFNSDWAGKLIIVVDEVLLNRREDSERLKNLSTARNYKMEAKGKDRQEVEFFAKFVLCSNNESFPIIIDPEEIRFWVRKVSHLETDDTNFLSKLIDEIPALLYHLQHRTLQSREESRMWFSPSDIHTEALDKIITANRSKVEMDMADVLMEIMVAENVQSMSFCITDLVMLLEYHRVKAEKSHIRRVLNDIWKLPHASNGLSYSTYQIDYNKPTHYGEVKKIGRFYTVTRDDIKHLC